MLAASVVEADERVSGFLVCSSLAGGFHEFPNYLTHTCKTHNEFGKVASGSFREMEACP